MNHQPPRPDARSGEAIAACIAVAFILALVACGSEPASDVTIPQDTGPDLEFGCTSDSDCDGGYCVGPPGCDAVWTCQDENPCSAAAPFVACTCRGVYDYVAAGCPGERWGYSDPQLPEYLLGAECPSIGPVERGNIVVRGSGFDEFNDEVALLSLRDHTHNANSYYGGVRVSDGGFEATWYGLFDPSEGDYTASLWFDDDASGDCSVGDRVWSHIVPDALTANEAVIDVAPGDEPAECPPEG